MKYSNKKYSVLGYYLKRGKNNLLKKNLNIFKKKKN